MDFIETFPEPRWGVIEIILGCYWDLVGIPLGAYQGVTGSGVILLKSFWNPVGSLGGPFFIGAVFASAFLLESY